MPGAVSWISRVAAESLTACSPRSWSLPRAQGEPHPECAARRGAAWTAVDIGQRASDDLKSVVCAPEACVDSASEMVHIEMAGLARLERMQITDRGRLARNSLVHAKSGRDARATRCVPSPVTTELRPRRCARRGRGRAAHRRGLVSHRDKERPSRQRDRSPRERGWPSSA